LDSERKFTPNLCKKFKFRSTQNKKAKGLRDKMFERVGKFHTRIAQRKEDN